MKKGGLHMSDFIRSEIVGAKIVEWYSCIIARSVDQAIQLQAEIKDMLKKNGRK